MKKSLAFGACVIAALTLNTQAQNLLVDPTFQEATFDQPNPIVIPTGVNGGWTGFGATLTGDSSVALADNAWNPSGVYQIVSATAGLDYTASAYFDNTGAASGSGGTGGFTTPFDVQIQFLNSAGTQVGTTDDSGWTGETLNSWVQVSTKSANGIAPAGTAYAEVYLMAMDFPVSGTDYAVENASLTVPSVPEPTTLALLGLGVVGGVIWRRRQ
jgi:hypothetical protein